MPTTAAGVCAIARALLGERREPPDVWDDARLLPYVALGYVSAARKLRTAKVSLLRKEATLVLPAVQKTLGRLSPGFPADFLRPLELAERKSGTTDPFSPTAIQDGLFKDKPLTEVLEAWDWRDDALHFRGATVSRDLLLQYEAELPALSSPSSLVLIPDGGELVALLASRAIARSKGQADLADYFGKDAAEVLGELVRSETELRAALTGRLR